MPRYRARRQREPTNDHNFAWAWEEWRGLFRGYGESVAFAGWAKMSFGNRAEATLLWPISILVFAIGLPAAALLLLLQVDIGIMKFRVPIWAWLIFGLWIIPPVILGLVVVGTVGLAKWVAQPLRADNPQTGWPMTTLILTSRVVFLTGVATLGGVASYVGYDLLTQSSPAMAPAQTVSDCHPSYAGACLHTGVGDYDCAGGTGDGPNYTGRVRVVGPDVFGLDRDNDGIGCE